MVQRKIFVRNHALGYVSNHIFIVTKYVQRRKEKLLIIYVRKKFYNYGWAHFTFLSVSGTHPNDTCCLSADTCRIYTIAENIVYAWKRGTGLKHTYKRHEYSIHIIWPFRSHLLLVNKNNFKVWNVKMEELLKKLNFSNEIFQIMMLIYPFNYMDELCS